MSPTLSSTVPLLSSPYTADAPEAAIPANDPERLSAVERGSPATLSGSNVLSASRGIGLTSPLPPETSDLSTLTPAAACASVSPLAAAASAALPACATPSIIFAACCLSLSLPPSAFPLMVAATALACASSLAGDETP